MAMIRRTKKPAKANPFLPAQIEDTTDAAAAEEAAEDEVLVNRGPARPAGGQPLPEDQLVFPAPKVWPPVAESVPEGARVQFVGLHGGAGVSTLAGLLGESGVDAGRTFDSLCSADIPVVLVARTSAMGAHLVARAAHQWASHGFPDDLEVAGVVLVDDAPKVPPELETFVRHSARAWPATWRMRWCEAIRLNPDPPTGTKGLPIWTRALTKSLLTVTAATPDVGMEEEHPEMIEGETS